MGVGVETDLRVVRELAGTDPAKIDAVLLAEPEGGETRIGGARKASPESTEGTRKIKSSFHHKKGNEIGTIGIT